MSGPTASNPLMFVMWWWQPAQGMPRKDEHRIYADLLQLHLNRRRETIPRPQPYGSRTAKEKSKTSSEGTLWEDLLL
jgi:hypothetical protein